MPSISPTSMIVDQKLNLLGNSLELCRVFTWISVIHWMVMVPNNSNKQTNMVHWQCKQIKMSSNIPNTWCLQCSCSNKSVTFHRVSTLFSKLLSSGLFHGTWNFGIRIYSLPFLVSLVIAAEIEDYDRYPWSQMQITKELLHSLKDFNRTACQTFTCLFFTVFESRIHALEKKSFSFGCTWYFAMLNI